MQTPDWNASKKKVHIRAAPIITLSSHAFEIATPRDSPTFQPPDSIEPADKNEAKIEEEPYQFASNADLAPHPESSKASNKNDGFSLDYKYDDIKKTHNYQLSPKKNNMEM